MMTILAIAVLIAIISGVVGALVCVFLVPWATLFALDAEATKRAKNDAER